MLHIKTITNEEWNDLYCKPLIFFGFHPQLSQKPNQCVAVAAFEDGICEYREIHKKREAYQDFFQSLLRKYQDAPIEVLPQKTQRILEQFEYERERTATSVYLYLKGSSEEVKRWSEELRLPGNVVSGDNPIQMNTTP
ncbi:MAG: hypothetical protein K2L24_02455 [Opitutales bacterium]|nr:hypothetical protein [Opitutales bacterium]